MKKIDLIRKTKSDVRAELTYHPYYRELISRTAKKYKGRRPAKAELEGVFNICFDRLDLPNFGSLNDQIYLGIETIIYDRICAQIR